MQTRMTRALPLAAAVLLVTAMAAVSELSGEREILFPEIAAIAAGALVSPKFAWRTSLLRMLLSIAAGSVTGVLIVLLLPLPLAAQMCIAYLIASLMLLFSGTTFAPMISSVVLPVMLGTRSPVYPVSAVILTAAVILLKMALDHAGLTQAQRFHPLPPPDRQALADMLIGWLLGSIVIAAAVTAGAKLAAAPPLLVAFTEFRRPGSKARQQPFAAVGIIAFSALAGAALRMAALRLGIYTFIAAAAAITLVLLLMRRTGMFIPPAAALSVLAFLIPEESLTVYPLLITAGAAVFTATAVISGKDQAQHPESARRG